MNEPFSSSNFAPPPDPHSALAERVAVLERRERDYRRLPFAEAAREFGVSLAELQDLAAAGQVVVCNVTSRPRVAMQETDRLWRERFHLMPAGKGRGRGEEVREQRSEVRGQRSDREQKMENEKEAA
jgi:hypothetical protein